MTLAGINKTRWIYFRTQRLHEMLAHIFQYVSKSLTADVYFACILLCKYNDCLLTSYKTHIISSMIIDNLVFQWQRYVPHIEVSSNFPLPLFYSSCPGKMLNAVRGKKKNPLIASPNLIWELNKLTNEGGLVMFHVQDLSHDNNETVP